MSENLDPRDPILDNPEEAASPNAVGALFKDVMHRVSVMENSGRRNRLEDRVETGDRIACEIHIDRPISDSQDSDLLNGSQVRLIYKEPLPKIEPTGDITRPNRPVRVLEFTFPKDQQLTELDPSILEVKVNDRMEVMSPIGSIIPPDYTPSELLNESEITIPPTVEQLDRMVFALAQINRLLPSID